MEKELIERIVDQIKLGNDVKIQKELYGNTYNIYFNAPDYVNNINIASIIAIPLNKDCNNQIVFESNNCEYRSKKKDIIEREKDTIITQLKSAINTGINLAYITSDNPAPIVVPFIPSIDNFPYLQQLSKECLELPESNSYYRIDKQVVNIIEKAKKIFKSELEIEPNPKIYLNGYSASGCFAQRFCMLQPEIIETACIGGASGSIPVPFNSLNYPLGIGDIKNLTGTDFNKNSYMEIKNIYYVAENELYELSENRRLENGEFAPMHDMSYFDRSVPIEVGMIQRAIFGYNMFERANNIVSLLKNAGIDINHNIIMGMYHGGGIEVLNVQKQIYNEQLKKDYVL